MAQAYNQALSDLGGALLNVGTKLMDVEIKEAVVADLNKASVAQMREFAKLDEFNRANDPSKWVENFDANQERIWDAISKEMNTPSAKQIISQERIRTSGRVRANMVTKATAQIKRNAATDLGLGVDAFNEAQTFNTPEDLTELSVNYFDMIDTNVVSKLITDKEGLQLKRDFLKNHLTNHRLATIKAEGMEEKEALAAYGNINTWARDQGIDIPTGKGLPGVSKGEIGKLFSPAEITELKVRYQKGQDAVDANITNTNKAMVSEATNEYQNAITGGDTSSKLREDIHQDPRFASDEVEATRLIDLLDKKNKEAIEKGKEVYSFAEIMDATESVELAIQQRDPNVKTIIAENADKLDEDLKASRKKALAYQEESLKVADTPETEGVRDAIAASSTLKSTSLALINARFPADVLNADTSQKTIDIRKSEIAQVNSDHIYRSREARKIGQLLDEGKITHSQAQERWDAIKVPAQEQEAKDVTVGIWESIFSPIDTLGRFGSAFLVPRERNFDIPAFGTFGPASLPGQKEKPKTVSTDKILIGPDGKEYKWDGTKWATVQQ